MPTYLLTWNPAKWQWTDIQKCIKRIDQTGFCPERWSTGVTRKIRNNDRVFLMKLGEPPRGIVASGWVASDTYENIHWSDASRTAFYVDVHFDAIVDPSEEAIFPIEALRDGIYSSVHWTPQASGMTIPDDVTKQLEVDWAEFLEHSVPVRQIKYADEVESGEVVHEGAVKRVEVNVYERDAEARAICIRKYGASCSVCGFDFGEKFGEIGKGFIHVHHLKPVSTIGEDYELDPIKDLRPVCPNCHAMIHSRDTVPYTIEELQAILKQNVK